MGLAVDRFSKIRPLISCADMRAIGRGRAGRERRIVRDVIFVREPAEIGGQGGIRTHGELAPTAVFKTAALNHSATCPMPAAIACDRAAASKR